MSTERRLRFVLHDTDAPRLVDAPTPGEPAGEFWREQWSRPFVADAMELRLVVEGVPPNMPEVSVELDFDSDWTACYVLVRDGDRWITSEGVTFAPRVESPKRLTDRIRKTGTIDRHLPRIERLMISAVSLNEKLDGDWWTVLALDWQLEGPRSRRGRRSQLDADEIRRLQTEESLTLPEIARRHGVHPKTPGNILYRAHKRKIPPFPKNPDAT